MGIRSFRSPRADATEDAHTSAERAYTSRRGALGVCIKSAYGHAPAWGNPPASRGLPRISGARLHVWAARVRLRLDVRERLARGGTRLIVHAYKHAQLMQESEARLERAAMCESPADMLVASCILHHPQAYRPCESAHN